MGRPAQISLRQDSTRSERAVTVACFGEALWDILPQGMYVGGAPLNVAYHLTRHRVRARLVSALGDDLLGSELRHRIREWGVDDRCVVTAKTRPTGTVRARLDAQGRATYRIARRVAWDNIQSRATCVKLPPPAALVFGTLALRGAPNRAALASFVRAWPNAWRVLDLNLRQPFTTKSAVDFALGHAQLLKLNDEELETLTRVPTHRTGALERAARSLAKTHGLTRICVTAGSRGAGLLWDGIWDWEAARPVKVRDTVGAGDSFLAAFLAAVLRGRRPPATALKLAARMGEFVASQAGATPAYRHNREGRIIGGSR